MNQQDPGKYAGTPPDRPTSLAASEAGKERRLPVGKVDAHHHVWRYSPEEYGWIDDGLASLRRDFLPDHLSKELARAGVNAAVAVQARQTIEETNWLLELAEADGSPVCGVVGWLPLTSAHLPGLLESYRLRPMLKGLRHVLQTEPDGFLEREDFQRGIEALDGSGLTYDLLIYARQLQEATSFVDRYPRQRFILDHIGKPRIRDGEHAAWESAIRELAHRPNVACKLSGMVTEANPAHWTAQQLQPYVDVVLEAFGPDRLMAGSDWPVLTVACGYPEWWSLLESWVSHLSSDEQAQILGGTATHWYGLAAVHPATLGRDDR